MLKLVSFQIQAHLNAFLQILEYFSQSVDVDDSWCIASLSCLIVRSVFLYTLPFNRPQRKKSAGVRSASPLFLTFQPISGWNTSMVHIFHQIPYEMPSGML